MRSTWREIFVGCSLAIAISACSGSGSDNALAPPNAIDLPSEPPIENNPPPVEAPSENVPPANDPAVTPSLPNDTPGGPPPHDSPPASDPPAQPLALVSSTPMDGAESVQRDVNPLLRFSAALDSSTVTAQSVKLHSAAGAAEISLSVLEDQVTIEPAAKLLPMTPHTLTVESSLRGAAGEQPAGVLRTSFKTRDGAWQSAAEAVSPVSAMHGQTAMDARGNFMTVWTQPAGPNQQEIWARYYHAGKGWQDAVRISDDDLSPYLFASAQVGMDAHGNAIAIWNDGGSSVWARRYTVKDPGTWGPVKRLAGSPSNLHAGPHLAVAPNGSAWIIWKQFGEQDFVHRIVAARYVPDGASDGWSEAFPIQQTGHYSGGARISAGNDGAAVAVWRQVSGSVSSVWGTTFDGETWLPARQLNEGAPDGVNLQIGLDSSGNALVIWEQSSPVAAGSGVLWFSRYSAQSGGWIGPAQVNHDIGFASAARIAVNARGNALLVWLQSESYNGPAHALTKRYYARENLWVEGSEQLDDTQLSSHLSPQVVLDAYGNGIVIWEQCGDPSADLCDVLAKRYLADAEGGAPAKIANKPATDLHEAVIAINAGGDAVATWTGFSRIHTLRFE